MTRGNPLSATSSTPSRQKGGEAVFARIYGAATLGLNGHVIAVETDISNGLPSFDLVGLAATSVKEAKERVRAAVEKLKGGNMKPMGAIIGAVMRATKGQADAKAVTKIVMEKIKG